MLQPEMPSTRIPPGALGLVSNPSSRGPPRRRVSDGTVRALSNSDLRRYLDAARTFRSARGWYEGAPVYDTLRFLVVTGIHPASFVNPNRSGLRIEQRSDLVWQAAWDRVKKTGADALTAVVIQETDVPWTRAVIEWYRANPRSTRWFGHLCADVAEASGINRKVSPRSLRHTFGTLVARKYKDPAMVMRLMNCSLKTAVGYLKGAEFERDADLAAEGGLLAGLDPASVPSKPKV